jgi:signal transduction histidine kinase
LEAVDLGALLGDVAELYEPLAEARGQTLTATANARPEIRGDRNLLFQAVANLTDNAVKFAPEGGQVGLDLTCATGEARLTVTDDGPGIPKAARQRVLERFFRLEASRSTPGSGLGLSLVAAVARLHHGELSLEDNAPGLRARLSLPLQPQA